MSNGPTNPHDHTTVPPGYQPYPPQGYYQHPAYAYQRPSQGLATAALVLGICAPLTGWLWLIVPILAIVFGGVALSKASSDPHRYGGKGNATAGLVLGIVSLAGWGLLWLALLGA